MNYKDSNSKREIYWENYFGVYKDWGIDPFGRKIDKNTFEVNHIWPISKGGEHKETNIMPLHPESSYDKGHHLNGTSNGKKFKVEGTKVQGILNVAGITYDYKGQSK